MTHSARMRYLFANSLFPVVQRLYRRNTDAAAEGVGSVWTSYLQSRVLFCFVGLRFSKATRQTLDTSPRLSPPHASLHGLCTGWPLFIYG